MTTATQPRAPKPPAFPTLTELSRAEYDPLLSTPWSRVYWVASKRTIGRRYKVVLDERTDTATCQCTAASFGKECSHMLLARTLGFARWWERELSPCAPAELRALIPGKACQVRCDVDALSAWAALLVIDALLLAADEPLEAAVAA